MVLLQARGSRGPVHDLRIHPGGILSVAFSTDGKAIATGGADGTLRIWDAITGAWRAQCWMPDPARCK